MNRVLKFCIFVMPLALCTFDALSTPALAAAPSNFVVTSTADTDNGSCTIGDCTLREAVNAANADADASVITFSPSAKNIMLGSGLTLRAKVTIEGPAAGVTVEGVNKSFNIFTVDNGVTAGFDSITIRNGYYGIVDFGTANITHSFLTDNVSGLKNLGSMNVTDSTLSGNYTGVENASGSVSISNSGIGSNSYGILNYSGTLNVAYSNLSGNVSGIKNFATATVAGSNFSGNYTGFENNNGSATLSTSTLIGNSFGVISYLGTLNVATSTLTNNSNCGIYNIASTANVTGSTLNGNDYGINNFGSGTVINSTLIGNRVSINIGGGGNISVINATVAGNSAYGVYNDGVIRLKNTIVAGNSFKIGGSNAITDDGHNLLDVSAGAVAFDSRGLRDNGGPTQTIGLLSASPAIDAGDSSGAPTSDQRGEPRVRGVDIGAFELQDTPPFIHDFSISTGKNTPYTFAVKEFDDNFSSAQNAQLAKIKITSLPTQGALTLNGNAVAVDDEIARADINTLVYTPEDDYDGSDVFTYAASDGTSYSSGSARVKITVNPGEDITIYSDPGQLITFFAYSMDVESGGTLYYSMHNAPFGATLNASTGEFRWTPTQAQAGVTYTFEINVSDGTRTATQKVTIHVR